MTPPISPVREKIVDEPLLGLRRKLEGQAQSLRQVFYSGDFLVDQSQMFLLQFLAVEGGGRPTAGEGPESGACTNFRRVCGK
jgi:hypothetical protein